MADPSALVRYADPSVEVGYAGYEPPSDPEMRMYLNDPGDDESFGSRTARAANSPLAIACTGCASFTLAWPIIGRSMLYKDSTR